MLDISILIVEDEPDVRAVLRQALAEEGYRIFEAGSRDEAMQCIAENSIDLATIDLQLDHVGGFEVAQEIRAKSNIPIVMITGRDKGVDRIAGLERGADEYIVKPFNIREVCLRIRNVLRRYTTPLTPVNGEVPAGRYAFDGCVLDAQKREVSLADGGTIDLTDLEFRLLQLFLENSNRIISRDEISHVLRRRVWSPLDRTLDGHIARLRRKLEASGEEPRLIKSVRGVGYVFTGEVSAV